MKYGCYWCTRCINVITFNVGILVIGIIMYSSDTNTYGQVITAETEEWDKGAIVDLKGILDSQSCPSDYSEDITGVFPGTQTYCHYIIGGGNTIGKCPDKSGGSTQYGLDPIEFNQVNGLKLCLQRGSLNYHQLAKQRGL